MTVNWATSGIALQTGQNVITVTAKDSANNSGMDVLTVTRVPPAVPNPMTGVQCNAMAIGDVDNDGIQDCVFVTAVGTNELVVLLGTGQGHFLVAQRLTLSANPTGVALGDFDGDGYLDAAVTHWTADASGQYPLDILHNEGDGTLKLSHTYYWGFQDETLAAGDFNKDGKLDLLVTSYTGNQIALWRGNGDGSFQPPAANDVYSCGQGPTFLCVRDFNNDGNLDAAVANRLDGTVSIMLGDGTGHFHVPWQVIPNMTLARGLASFDYNGDGNADLAVGLETDQPNNVCILLNDGHGVFAAGPKFSAGRNPMWICAGDIDGDSRKDLVVANAGSSDLTVLLADRAGGLRRGYSVSVGAGPDDMGLLDWDGDGKLDAVVGEWGAQQLQVVSNTGLHMPGDINGDWHVDVIDLLCLAGSWAKSTGQPGFDPRCDLNSDGVVNVIDLLILADNWGT